MSWKQASACCLAPVVAMTLFVAVPAAAAPEAIRTGGPSAPSEPKVALVGSDRQLAGRRFVVRGAGRVVLRGHLRRTVGRLGPWRRIFRADLSAVTEPGAYRVRTAGLRSRRWIVARPNGELIDRLLGFFRANRDGLEPSPLHGPSHLNDALVASGPLAGRHIDMTGGWMDAGDQLHFTQTTAFSAALLGAAARLAPGRAPALEAEADIGVRWLEEAHPAPGVFIAQVGDARDHERGFTDPAADDSSLRPGIGTRLAYPAIGGDLGGKAATALALAADRSTGARRATLVAEARQWYAAGARAAGPAPRVEPAGFYALRNWRDSMAGGASALYRTTGEVAYLDDALHYLRRSATVIGLGWGDFAPFAAADLCGALGAPSLASGRRLRAARSALRDAARHSRRLAARTPFGTPGEFIWGQVAQSNAAGAQAALAAGRLGVRGGRRIAVAARDWLLGRNPFGASFVAGYGPRSPERIHSWASVFGDGLPAGAVVGGPTRASVLRKEGFASGGRFSTRRLTYRDRRRIYVHSEPALDYSATAILLVAALQGSA